MKKPKIKKFIEVAKACNGNLGSIAASFEVTRRTIHNWMNEDPEFRDAVDDHKGALLDRCVSTATVVALGIVARDENGTACSQEKGRLAPPQLVDTSRSSTRRSG